MDMNLESILVPEKVAKVVIRTGTSLKDVSLHDLIAASARCPVGSITLSRPPEDRSMEEEDEYY